MASSSISFFKSIQSSQIMIGFFDIETSSYENIAPAADILFTPHLWSALPRTISIEHHIESALEVVEKKSSCTDLEWIKYSGYWHNLAITKTYVDTNKVLIIAQEITHLDPRAQWLARINLTSQRLELDNGESFSFDEFVVLHLLLKGHKYKQIARNLKVSPKTVEYRLSRLKIALEVETTAELMFKIASNGLIHLVLIPTDPANPAMTEVELYKKVGG